jgi:hypothetical protein
LSVADRIDFYGFLVSASLRIKAARRVTEIMAFAVR